MVIVSPEKTKGEKAPRKVEKRAKLKGLAKRPRGKTQRFDKTVKLVKIKNWPR
jgi:hypothetical protein